MNLEFHHFHTNIVDNVRKPIRGGAGNPADNNEDEVVLPPEPPEPPEPQGLPEGWIDLYSVPLASTNISVMGFFQALYNGKPRVNILQGLGYRFFDQVPSIYALCTAVQTTSAPVTMIGLDANVGIKYGSGSNLYAFYNDGVMFHVYKHV